MLLTLNSSVNDSPINDEPVPSNETPDKPIEEKVTSLTWDNLGNNKRRFNFDLVPKVRIFTLNYFRNIVI